MKKTKKIIISIILSILIISAGLFIFYKFFYDANRLSLTEKEWINEQKNSIITFNMPGEVNVFSSSGKGVFYEFLDGFEKDNEITVNKNIINNNNELGFVIKNTIENNDLLIHKDHYVIVSKNHKDITKISDLNGENIGVLNETLNIINNNYKITASFTTLNNKSELISALKEDKVAYIIVSLNEYIDTILENNYSIVYHLDDLVNYYYIHLGKDKVLNSIVRKYYNNWIKNSYEESYYQNLNELFIEKLKITQIDIDKLTSKSYNYGFVSNTPFETLKSGKYGGKIINYLESFSKFSKVDFTFLKFNNYNELAKSFEKKKIDLMFNNSSIKINGNNIKTNINDSFYIISPINDAFKVSKINNITNTDIYVIKDSKLSTVLKEYKNINLKLVKNEKELIKIAKKNRIIAIPSETYEYLKNSKINNYQIVYSGNNSNYDFIYQTNNDTFIKMFSNYVNFVSDYDMNNNGVQSFSKAESNGNFISLIAKYILTIISISILLIGITIVKKKNIKLNTKIKKDEKLKFIDILTSLKNRNYLNERIETWNQNTIYPQAIIVIDLNNIKYLNDTFGHEEGDKQIMAAANILHQTQLDNTEIMRTDGNEFMIYLVGYNEKQVINYLKKLIKEFKELPYEYGAAFGFSMIVDDLKLIDDAINEATIQMRENKDLESEKHDSEN